MSRGNGRMPIFLDDVDYGHFVYLLSDVVEEYDIECWNYCAMPNHYHATLRPRKANFSKAMQRLNGGYASWWNKRHQHVGHVFQGRFKDQIVQRDGYLLKLSRYVMRNPVRARLVERPEDWPWSSYRATAGLENAPPFLAVAATLSLFGHAEDRILRARFTDYVMGDHVDPTIENRIRSNERILGDTAFKAMIRAGVHDDSADNQSSPAGASQPVTEAMSDDSDPKWRLAGEASPATGAIEFPV